MNKSYLSSIILVAVNIGILAWWYTNTTNGAQPLEEPLTMGDTFPEITLMDQNREPTNLKTWAADRWTMIMYCRYKLPWQNIHYLQTLSDHFKDRNFQSALIINQDANLNFTQTQQETLRTQVFHESGDRAATALGLYRDGVFLVNPEGEVAFSAAFMLKREDLRKVTEKFLTGSINYQSGGQVQPNKQNLENLTVFDVSAGEFGPLTVPDNAHFIVLTAAMCSVCNTDNHFELISKTVEALRTNENTQYDFVGILLTAGFDLERAEASLLEHQLEIDLFQATEKIKSFEDDYFTDRTGILPKMIAASIDAKGVMTSRSVSELYDRLTHHSQTEEVYHAN